MKLFTIRFAQDLIDKYVEKGGEMLTIDEGCLGVGNVILFDMTGKLKSFVIKEVYLNEWNSAQSIRGYNKLPDKYVQMIKDNY